MSLELALAYSRSDCSQTCLDELTSLVNNASKFPGDIVEVGSYKCGATILMALTAPAKTVFAFDTFGGLPYGLEQLTFLNFQYTDWDEIRQVTSAFPNIVLIRGRHEQTISVFPTKTLSFVFLDSDFYSSHRVALNHFWPMLCSGGFLLFHDWKFDSVQQAILDSIDPSQCSMWKKLDTCDMGLIQKL